MPWLDDWRTQPAQALLEGRMLVEDAGEGEGGKGTAEADAASLGVAPVATVAAVQVGGRTTMQWVAHIDGNVAVALPPRKRALSSLSHTYTAQICSSAWALPLR